MTSTLSLVIPCYNEEETLEACVTRVLQLSSDELKLDIIIVDDCSTDSSRKIAATLAAVHPEVTLIAHENNRGKGAALRSGFARARGDFVGIQDADLEYDPLQYRTLLRPILENRADVVFGSRYLKTDARRVLYFWHTWMNQTLTRVSNMVTNLDITDMETCYKLFRRSILERFQLHENRFGFEPEITARVAQTRCRVYECAIDYTPRTYEEGKKIGWRDGLWALYCILHYGAPTAPIPVQLFLYGVVGAVSAITNVASFTLLSSAGLKMELAVVCAFVFAAALNYLLCILFLFEHNARWRTSTEILLYLSTVVVMGTFDLVATLVLQEGGMSPTGSKALAAILGFVGNFALRRFIVFPKPTVVRV